MSNMELALKIFVIWFVGLFLLAIGLNFLMKKEHRHTLKELALEHIRITSVTVAVCAVTGAFAWLLFKVL